MWYLEFNKNCQIEIVKDMENFWCQTVSDNGRTCFFNTSLSIIYFVACSPQTITNHHISKILKSVVHLILTTSNGSRSNAHPILIQIVKSPMLTQFSPVQIVQVQCSSLQIVPNAMLTQFSLILNAQVQHSPNSHLLQLSAVQYSADFHLIRNHPDNSHPILTCAVESTHAILTS